MKNNKILDQKTIQQIAHYHGIEAFIEMLTAAMFDASEEMESISVARSNQYQQLANHVDSLELSSGEE